MLDPARCGRRNRARHHGPASELKLLASTCTSSSPTRESWPGLSCPNGGLDAKVRPSAQKEKVWRTERGIREGRVEDHLWDAAASWRPGDGAASAGMSVSRRASGGWTEGPDGPMGSGSRPRRVKIAVGSVQRRPGHRGAGQILPFACMAWAGNPQRSQQTMNAEILRNILDTMSSDSTDCSNHRNAPGRS